MLDPNSRSTLDSGLASLEHRAYVQIKEAIITLTLPIGAPIVEAQLAERLGISKTPLRAALLELERDGLVTSIPYKGSRVAPITVEAMRQLLQLREAIETYAVRQAIRACSEADFAALERLLELREEALAADDLERSYVLDDQFHRTLIGFLGNPHFTRISSNVSDHRRRMRYATSHTRAESAPTVGQHHRALLEALRARDIATAEQWVSDSVRSALNRIQTAVNQAESTLVTTG
jgi:DNA-binding GntR family transcriptional regulator